MNYKYIHFFLVKSAIFNKIFIEMAMKNDKLFHLNESLFVTYDKSLFEEYKDKCNIVYYPCSKFTSINMINKYGDCGEWLFVHNLPLILAMFIRKKYYKKILWRTWGDDLTFNNLKDKDIFKHNLHYNFVIYLRDLITNIFVKIIGLEEKSKRIVREFYAVGVANSVDKTNIINFCGNVRMFEMPYYTGSEYQILSKAKEKKYHDDYLHILIEHSGLDYGQIDITKKLKKYEGQKLFLHFPLNYGPKKWIDEIIKYVNENWSGKKEFILDYMSYEKYTELLNKIDIFILSSNKSTALGNLSMCLFLNKTIYLSRKGIIARVLKTENVPFRYIDELDNFSFNDLSKLLDYKIDNNNSLSCIPYDVCVDRWKIIFEDLH